MNPPTLTPVERAALARSRYEAQYAPTEKVPTIVVDHFPELGRLTALRFLEWVQQNPEGVVSLPTGKTPEYFIRWVRHLLETWDEAETQAMLEGCGLDPARRPETGGLRFVQIDEFYPIDPRQENSFYHYVNRFYIEGLGLDRRRALLMNCREIGLGPGESLQDVCPDNTVDLSLRYRPPEDGLERRQKELLARVDQWCQDYENHIRRMGGIGFFLGGIGPDGHVAFNVRGSDHHSTTRLTRTNYETQAAASTDLGGIEIARRRLVITIGLGTITCNPDCTAVIIAAGEAKSGVVADAVQREPDVLYPATALHALPNARLFVTQGAAGGLIERRLVRLRTEPVTDADCERILVDRAVETGKKVIDLTEKDLRADRRGAALLERRPEGLRRLARTVQGRLLERIEHGSQMLSNTRFLHTEPHHDDIMLGYLADVVRHARDPSNTHHFVTLTSGFTSVSNHFMLRQVELLRRFARSKECAALMAEGYFEPDNDIAYNRDVWQYLDGVAADDRRMREEGVARRMLRNLREVCGRDTLEDLRDCIEELHEYLSTRYPGGRDAQHVQKLKGMCREWEAECLWGYLGWSCSYIHHLRLGFYTGAIFTEAPTVERDVAPVLGLLEEVRPDVVTVALDPEGSGPDTHYKTLQAITEALKRYERRTGRRDVKVWAYRNVWHRFHPAEANIYVPVSLNMFSIMDSAFYNAFASQRDASFPSWEHDGPFSELAQRIQVRQYQVLKTCLGRTWFHENPSSLIRATRGLAFLKEMSLPELYEHSRHLRQATESL